MPEKVKGVDLNQRHTSVFQVWTFLAHFPCIFCAAPQCVTYLVLFGEDLVWYKIHPSPNTIRCLLAWCTANSTFYDLPGGEKLGKVTPCVRLLSPPHFFCGEIVFQVVTWGHVGSSVWTPEPVLSTPAHITSDLMPSCTYWIVSRFHI